MCMDVQYPKSIIDEQSVAWSSLYLVLPLARTYLIVRQAGYWH